jgi:ElaB/YqjD/DUF883 family membrane-anchored ribosome-binding protein
MSHVTGDRLIEDLKHVIRDAEELLKVTAGQVGEKVAEVRGRAEDSLHAAKARLAAVTGETAACAAEAADHADASVRANPWISIGAGAAAGLLVGLLLGRRGGGSR